MEDDIKTFVHDILNAIQEIESFFIGRKKEFFIRVLVCLRSPTFQERPSNRLLVSCACPNQKIR